MHGLPPPERATTESVPMFCWPADAVRLPKSMFPLGWICGTEADSPACPSYLVVAPGESPSTLRLSRINCFIETLREIHP